MKDFTDSALTDGRTLNNLGSSDQWDNFFLTINKIGDRR